uniref:Zinc finger, CCHC-type n=1 Tax=Tanacetum cinerariifolium TaxID=118510 RepID=A0A6L2JQ10_TANCI|nr:zinc finger, CCHC-type [Tanacetum cinerariifolium]
MAAAAMKHMASSFTKLEKFEGLDFRRWQKKIHFMLFSMSVVYELTTPMPKDGGENLTVEQVRKRAKWDNDDYVCRCLILNGMSNSLFDIYQNVDTSKELWDTLKVKYMAEDASSKKFIVSNFTNYKMTDSRPVLDQYNELLGILERFTQYKMNMNESIKVSCIIDKLPSSWKDFKHTLKHLKEELTLVELGSHLRIEESLRAQDNDKPKGNNVAGPSVVNMLEHNNSSRYNDHKGKRKNHDTRANPNKKPKDDDVGWWVDSEATVHVYKDRCWFKTYESLNDGSILHMGNELTTLVHGRGCVDLRFYVIEPNDSVAINSIIESRDDIFDEHRFSSVPRLSQRSLVKGTEDSGGSVVSERVTDEIVQQSESELKKRKRHRTSNDFGHAFQLYLIEGPRDEVSDQHSYCFNVEDDPKIFDEAMKSQSTSRLQASGFQMDFKRKMKLDGNVEKFKAITIRLLIGMASIHNMIIHRMDVKTTFLNGDLEDEAPKQWHQKFDEVVLSNGYLLNQADKCVYRKFDASGKGVIICLYVDDMLIFGADQVQVDLTKEFLSSRFSMKDMGEADVILVSTPLDTYKKLMPNRGLAVSQLEYSRVISCLMYAMTCIRPDIAFTVGKLSRYTSNPRTQHWQAIQRVLKYLKKTMDYRLVYSGYPLVLEGYTDASWISNTEDNSSTSGWVLLLGDGAISWASKKQTCITGFIMESEFVALAAAGKEAKWLKNFLLEITLWVKPIASISIRCDSAATLAKAYSQMYNGKSRHLSVRHSMIRKLITNGVVYIEFVMSQQNLAGHLTKGLSRDLVIKSAEGMGLKSN